MMRRPGPSENIGLCVILAELIGPLPLNSPDQRRQNYNCMSHFLASRRFVMRRGRELQCCNVVQEPSLCLDLAPFIPRVKLAERSPPANQRTGYRFLISQNGVFQCAKFLPTFPGGKIYSTLISWTKESNISCLYH